MPELPEVETVRSQLAPLLEGRVLERVRILDQRLTRPVDPREVELELTGERVALVDRRGKYLLVRFESGLALVVHLRMTGSFGFGPASHERARVDLDDGRRLVYRDVRRFGTWLVLPANDLERYFAARLGREPIDRRFTVRELEARLAGRRAAVKAVLLDQRVVAGLGNIYADEALWHGRVSPLRPAGELTRDELRALATGIRTAIRRGVERQGATLRDYATPDGAAGSMQEEFRVYGRDGERCRRCRGEIVKTRIGGRGTHFCPTCQR
jgi:formamidopyrimidine-DNA glycosylase